VRKEHDLAIQWTAFPLHPETPDQGRTLEDLFAGRGLDIPKMLDHLKQTADQLGLAFGRRTMTYNSRRAQELGKWAEDNGQGEAFHHKAFHAYFAEGRNIAQPDVLGDLVEKVGLNRNEAQQVLLNGTYQDAVDADWQRARQMGIHAVPTFHMKGLLLVGAQTYGALNGWVKENITPLPHK
jgi:predicted DsbA family dithiol-disulfide isomerase